MRNTIKGLSLVLSFIFSSCTAKEKPVVKEEFKEPVKAKVKEGMEVATFAGGCFWCTEAVFLEIKGVEKVVSGYIGGKTVNPTYKDICTGETGHAEAIQITFNPNEVAYEDLLEVFFGTHDPTTLNRQGADVGRPRGRLAKHDGGDPVPGRRATGGARAHRRIPRPPVRRIQAAAAVPGR